VSLCIPTSLLGNGYVRTLLPAMNSHATVEEWLDASFSMRSASCESNVGHYCLPEIPVYSYVRFNGYLNL
jgi:hypothetical protein